MGIEVFRQARPGRAPRRSRITSTTPASNDLFLTYVIINPQADRSKDWGEQDEDLVARIVDEDAGGITIRGAKMLGTSAIMANEVFVANLQPLRAGRGGPRLLLRAADEHQGPARAVAQVATRRRAVSIFDNPLSSRFDENDALIYFDDVKVPWERVFVHRDTDMCRAQFHDTPATSIRTTRRRSGCR